MVCYLQQQTSFPDFSSRPPSLSERSMGVVPGWRKYLFHYIEIKMDADITLLFAFVIPAILFLFTQQKTLQVIQPLNREMKPGLVWLQLIPIFGQIWQFFVVTRIAKSIWKEVTSKMGDSILEDSKERMEELNESPTFNIGMAYCVLFTLGIIINSLSGHWSPYWQLIGPVLSFTGMSCWIIYWVKLAKTKNKLIGMSINSMIPLPEQMSGRKD